MDCSFYIKLAGVCIAVQPLHGYVKEYCKDYLCDEEPEFWITTQQCDIDEERARSAREDILEGIPVRSFSDSYLETLAVYRKIAVALLEKDILLIHGSCVAVDGKAYLFTARSGTGKSTHVRLWLEKFGGDASVLNDDKPLLRIDAECVTAYGTPWDGKHRLSVNCCASLCGICILTRSETNQIRKLSAKEGYPLILQQTYRPEDPLALMKTLKLIDKMLERTGLYLLGCNMNPEAAEVSYTGMRGEQ